MKGCFPVKLNHFKVPASTRRSNPVPDMKITQLSPSRLSPLLGLLIVLTEHLGSAALPTLHLKPVVQDQFHAPTAITAANDGSGRVFVCDQPGIIYIIQNGLLLPIPFLNISNTAVNIAHRKVLGLTSSYDERGLLSMAFHPGYANPASAGFRKFFVSYNKAYQAGIDPPPHNGGTWTPNCTTVIAEFQVSADDPNVAEPLSERKLLLFPQPQTNHNGGNIVFDANGLLYIGSGDGGSADDNNVGHTGGASPAPRPTGALGNGQDKTVYLGKILRIDPFGTNGPGGQYGIPATNPFVNVGGGVKAEIYAFGIRNPWGLAFDDGPGGTGRLFCADVGQGRIEEVNLITNGGNYGWRYLEGTERPSFSSTMAHPGGTLIDPILQYGHPGMTGSTLPLLGLSITGGYVYRGTAIPALQGSYVFGDYGATNGAASGRMMALEPTVQGGDVGTGAYTFHTALSLVGPNPFPIRVLCLGEDENGEIYVGGKVSGGVLALQTGLPNGAIYKIVPAPAVVNTTTVEPVQDNSIFGDLGPMGEELSNGTGNLFAGRTGSGINRRALLKFDVSSIPAGSTVVSATLRMTVNAVDGANPGARNFDLFKLREEWGEAGSFDASGPTVAQNNDATWENRFYSASTPIPWNFSINMPYWNSSSAVASLTTVGDYTWTHQLFGDVRSWLANPSSNQGWILIGNEGVIGTAKQFESRESAAPSVRPRLTITHVPPTPFETWLATYFPGLPTGGFFDPDGERDVRIDYDRNGTTDLLILTDKDGFKHQIEYAYGFSPLVADAPGSDNFTSIMAPGAAGSTDLTLTFRRNSAATDLTYQLQVSSDLTNWTTVAQSSGGAIAVGLNGGLVQSDNVLSGSARVVTILKNLAVGFNSKQFVRLRVERAP